MSVVFSIFIFFYFCYCVFNLIKLNREVKEYRKEIEKSGKSVTKQGDEA